MSAEVTRELAGELAAFLRTRRERLDPADVALPGHGRGRRRTPGLRREEVAELAGVSVDYVVRLEQGRGLNPSPEVLDALAGALRLSDDERTYLFDLARQRPTTRAAVDPDEALRAAGPSGMAQLVRDLSPLPAILVDHRFDVHASNPEMAALVPGLRDAGPGRRRNVIELCLLNPAMRGFYPDREQILREGIADLRAAWATRPDDAELAGMIAGWRSDDADFARLWELRDVQVNSRGDKRLCHPVGGPLTVSYQVLHDATHRLTVYRAADAASQVVLDRITRGLQAVG